jgi:hypothetical protein
MGENDWERMILATPGIYKNLADADVQIVAAGGIFPFRNQE